MERAQMREVKEEKFIRMWKSLNMLQVAWDEPAWLDARELKLRWKHLSGADCHVFFRFGYMDVKEKERGEGFGFEHTLKK